MAVSLMLLLLGCSATIGTNSASDAEGPGPFDWFKDALPIEQDPLKPDSAVANVLVLMAALQATDAVAGFDIMKLLVKESAASTRTLADRLHETLGDMASFQPPEDQQPGPGSININLGQLLDLNPTDLDVRLAATAKLLGLSTPTDSDDPEETDVTDGTQAETTPNSDGRSPAGNATQSGARNSAQSENATQAGAVAAAGGVAGGVAQADPEIEAMFEAISQPASAQRGLRQAKAPAKKQATRVLANGTATITSKPATLSTITITRGSGNGTKQGKASRKGKGKGLLGSLGLSLGVDWEALQDKIQDAARSAFDNTLNNKRKIKKAEWLQQMFRIFTDQVTSGEGLGEGCTPYVFNGGGARLPETCIFPSFSISQTTGNCVLIPEFIGNAEFPGQWSLLNSRVACLGPATEYLQVPAFYRAAATSSESFTCPTCRNEFSIGPAVTITLVGDTRRTVRYRNKAEFLAALKTNKTWGFDKGMDGVLAEFRTKLEANKEVLSRHLGTKTGFVGAISEWVNNAWGKWGEGAQKTVTSSSLRQLLEEQMDPEGGGGAGGLPGDVFSAADRMAREFMAKGGDGGDGADAADLLREFMARGGGDGADGGGDGGDGAGDMFNAADLLREFMARRGDGGGGGGDGTGDMFNPAELVREFMARGNGGDGGGGSDSGRGGGGTSGGDEESDGGATDAGADSGEGDGGVEEEEEEEGEFDWEAALTRLLKKV